MIEETLLAIWGAWTLLILFAAFRVLGFSAARRRQDRRWGDGSGSQKPVALVVSVKGFDIQATPRFFDILFDQTYRDYRVIVCFESWDDPVSRWLCEHLELSRDERIWRHPDPSSGLREIALACGGLAVDEGQKVHNQRAAFADLSPRDAIVAFADADILLGRDWLARLVAPINHGSHELSTTYRWLVPRRPTLPNQLACVINASITTQGGNELTNILWGGSMALSRGLFDEIDVPALLAGSLNDDLRISKAARATGRKVAFVRSLVLPTPIEFGWRGLLEFARRQYTQFKIFSPIFYFATNVVIGFYVLGLATIVGAIVYGYFLAWVPVAASYVIDQFRALARQQVYLSLFKDPDIRRRLFATSWLEHMFSPAWILLNWCLLASTWTQRRLTWAGVRYQIVSPSRTKVLGRAAAPRELPAGAPGLALVRALHDRVRREMVPASAPIRAEAALPAPFDSGAVQTGTAAAASIAGTKAAEIAAKPASERFPAASASVRAKRSSAVSALARSQPVRRLVSSPELRVKTLGPVPRAVAVLQKTRLPAAAALFVPLRGGRAPVASEPVESRAVLPAAVASAPPPCASARSQKPPSLAAGPRSPLFPSLATRWGAGDLPKTFGPPARAAAALQKTRLPAAAACSVPLRGAKGPGVPKATGVHAPVAPAVTRETSPAPKPSPHAGAPRRCLFPSLAARRAVPGSTNGSGGGSRSRPARSGRARPAARPAGSPAARPVCPGPSGRP